jgi:hypothetical protein
LVNPNVSKDDWEVDHESDIEQDNGIEDAQTPVKRDVTVTPNVPRLNRPLRRSKKQAKRLIVTVGAVGVRRNKGNKKTADSMA